MKKYISMFLVVLLLVSSMSVSVFALETGNTGVDAPSPVYPLSDAPAMTSYIQTIGGVTFSNVVKHEFVTGYDYDGAEIPMYKVTLGVEQPSATCMKSTSNKTDFIMWNGGFNAPQRPYIDPNLRTGGVMEHGHNSLRNLECFGITAYADDINPKGECAGSIVWKFDPVENKTYSGTFKMVHYITAVVDGQISNFMITVTNRPDFKNGSTQQPSTLTPEINAPKLPETATAYPASYAVYINGEKVVFESYSINGSSYFKLKDISYSLLGTEKQFNVVWDGSLKIEIGNKSYKGAVLMYSRTPYTITGGEMDKGDGTAKPAKLTASPLFLDNNLVYPAGYNIKGHNFFKLRDLGEMFNFNVSWDENIHAIIINTAEAYDPLT